MHLPESLCNRSTAKSSQPSRRSHATHGNRLLCRSSQFRDRPLGASKLSRQLPNTHLLCSQRAYLVDYLQTQLPTDKFAILADFEQLSTTRRLIRTEYPYTSCRTAKVLSRLMRLERSSPSMRTPIESLFANLLRTKTNSSPFPST
jgi:hypothetical protein